MQDLAKLKQRERLSYAALSRLRDALDALPEDHPSAPLMIEAVALADGYWRTLREELEAIDRAAREAKD